MDINDPKTAKLIIAGIGIAAVLYIHFGTTFLPFSYKAEAKELNELEGRYEALSLEINRARQSAKNLPHLEAEYEALQAKWEEANQLLPRQKQITSLLREISFRGQSCGVEFTLFKPLPNRAGDFYTENPIEIKVEGGYHEIAAFLNEMASMTRIVNARDIEIEQIPPEKESCHAAEIHFTAVAYTLQAGAAAPSGESGGVVAGAKKIGKLVSSRSTRSAAAASGGSDE
ncbi:MAG: type 4a pilus biogenesis protein PilO [Candidatus Eisenbacteria sp.]|nr:type 4a pilus biogenesis protein PilO [Candidatus Eisenbacteria bacterium]